ncbi:Uncharacterised protein [Plesiomonas shigelloides]|uniref:hypothetical protein n=1 Tax=Plesiomonas shigelloides TaxID=703 RepID=UPI000E069711|nr:hypothetical protein [Plesiomonas shigelloides]SUB63550.1 Uncharacterised protein [Plesiomonas shigelloides]
MNCTKHQHFAFVIMPFSPEFNDIYKLGIKEAAKECGVLAERLDEQMFSEGMLERIYRQIDTADFIIADLSTRNANVFYELGYAHAKGKTCILLTKDVDDIPFDLKHKRHIVYNGSISLLKDELIKNIEWAKYHKEANQNSSISVITKQPTGILNTTKYTAEASITLTFDLHNKTNHISPEISAIYLYTNKQWNVSLETKECPYSESDIEQFKYRYFISPPVQKIGRNGWAPVRIQASRVIAMIWSGDEIKEEYTIGGRGILRVEMSNGNFDHEFDFILNISEIPF